MPSRTVTRQITAYEIRYVCIGYPYSEKERSWVGLEPENPDRGGPQGGGRSVALYLTGVENIPLCSERNVWDLRKADTMSTMASDSPEAGIVRSFPASDALSVHHANILIPEAS